MFNVSGRRCLMATLRSPADSGPPFRAPPPVAGVTPKRLADTGLKRETYRAATAMECLVRWRGVVVHCTGWGVTRCARCEPCMHFAGVHCVRLLPTVAITSAPTALLSA